MFDGFLPRRALVFTGIGFLCAGLLCYAAGRYLAASADVAQRTLGQGLLVPVPWLFLGGTVTVLLFLVVRRAAQPPVMKDRESMLFGESTTLQAPEPPLRDAKGEPPARRH